MFSSEDFYNQQLEVFDADEKRQKFDEFPQFLEDVKQVLIKHSAAKTVAVRLLHKHNNISQDDVMLESHGTLDDGEQALITTLVRRSEAPAVIHPSIWMTSEDGKWRAMEFSSDNHSVAASKEIEQNALLRKDLSEVVTRYQVNDFLGFSTSGRDILVSNDPSETLLEFSDIESVSNIIVCRDHNYCRPPDDFVETTWTFDEMSETVCGIRCRGVCRRYSPGHGRDHDSTHFPMTLGPGTPA